MKLHPLPTLCLLLTLAATTCGALRADDEPRAISTLGVAERRYPAERANIYLEIESIHPSTEEANRAVTSTHEKLEKALKQLDVPRKDVRLISRETGRRTRWDGNKEQNVFLGFYCIEYVQVVLTDLSQLEAVTTTLAAFDTIEVQGIGFESDKEGAEKRAALLDAAKAAREKAEALASAAGVRLTRVLEIVEQSSADREYYGNIASNTTVRTSEPGQGLRTLHVSVTVRARYAIE